MNADTWNPLELIGLITIVLLAVIGVICIVGLFGWNWYYSRLNHSLTRGTVLISGANCYEGRNNLGMELAVQALERGATTLILLDCVPITLSKDLVGNGVDKAKIILHTCDVSNASEVEKVYYAIKDEVKQIDFIFNCAGIVSGKSFQHLTPATFQKTMEVNVLGNYHVIYYFTKLMNHGGVVVGVSSFMGLMGSNQLIDYCASKFALVGLYESLRFDCGTTNQYICACPYAISTGMFEGIFEHQSWRQRVINFFFPLISPKYCAGKILTAAQNGRNTLVVIPFLFAPLINVVRCIPDPLYDWILRLMGAEDGMKTFRGRRNHATQAMMKKLD